MTKEQFLNPIEQNCSEILYLCVDHILNKIYKDNEEFDEKQNIEFFTNYKNYHRYLNDFAGIIYNRFGSHINSIYIEMCEYLGVEVDNKYTLEHTIVKLEKQTPDLLLSLTNEDIQKQTIEHFDERLQAIEESSHYLKNRREFQGRVRELYENILIVKRALNLQNKEF